MVAEIVVTDWAIVAVVVQAIRDGVIEATIDHEKGYVQSKESSDIYSTGEPMAAFHQRISFCLDIHNQSVKVSGFPGSRSSLSRPDMTFAVDWA